MKRAIFLDRDGVIIENRPDYVRSWDEVSIIPAALEALKKLNSTNFMIIIVTNQSAVGRGFISLAEAEEINRKLLDFIHSSGGRVDAVFMCPHSPEENCDCRKPKSGLLMDAAERYAIDLDRSVMIGDAVTDLIAGSEAGVKDLILVLTGRGEQQKIKAEQIQLPFSYSSTLLEAIEGILSG